MEVHDECGGPEETTVFAERRAAGRTRGEGVASCKGVFSTHRPFVARRGDCLSVHGPGALLSRSRVLFFGRADSQLASTFMSMYAFPSVAALSVR